MVDSAVACISAATGGTPEELCAAQLACIPEDGPNCADFCAPLADCGVGDGILDTFADVTACETFCGGLAGEDRVSLNICIRASGCAASTCDNIGTPSVECEAACDSAIALCGDGSGSDADICPWFCAGIDAGAAGANTADAAACLDALSTCAPNNPAEDVPDFAPSLFQCITN